jgi:thiol:disulfide interchange protein DsbC
MMHRRSEAANRIFNQRVELMKKVFIALAAAFFAVSCGVQANPDEVKKELAKKFPDLKTERITKTTYGGLFEVFTGTEIFYTDEKATFVVTGSLIDTATRANVTEARVNKLTAIKFDELPFENAIKIVRGDGSRRMAIFEDPLCGYCKKFEADVNSLNNITAYVFLYPILAQDSFVKSKAIWCAKDSGAAWQDWMLRDKAPPSPAPDSCQTPVDQNVALGQKLRINGTPVTFFVDGERMVGALPLATIEAKLASALLPPKSNVAAPPTAAAPAPAAKK